MTPSQGSHTPCLIPLVSYPLSQPQPQISIASRTLLPLTHSETSHHTGPLATASAASHGGCRACVAEFLHPRRRWRCRGHALGEDQTAACRTAPQTGLEPTWSRSQSWCLAPLRREESKRSLYRLSGRNRVKLRSCCSVQSLCYFQAGFPSEWLPFSRL